MAPGEPHHRPLEGAMELRRAAPGRRHRVRGRGAELMTLRISERYGMALNLSLIAILAYFLALSVNDLILGRAAGCASMHLASLVGPTRSAPATRPRALYDAIYQRDIFNLE